MQPQCLFVNVVQSASNPDPWRVAGLPLRDDFITVKTVQIVHIDSYIEAVFFFLIAMQSEVVVSSLSFSE